MFFCKCSYAEGDPGLHRTVWSHLLTCCSSSTGSPFTLQSVLACILLMITLVINTVDRYIIFSYIGVAKSRTRLSDFTFTFTFHFHALEKEIAIHSSVLAWRIPGMGSLVGFHLWGRTELDTTEAT